VTTRFELHRHHDVSGISGTGVVAEGIVFSDGTAVLHWLGEWNSTVVHKSVEQVIAVHGHSGATELIFGQPNHLTLTEYPVEPCVAEAWLLDNLTHELHRALDRADRAERELREAKALAHAEAAERERVHLQQEVLDHG
jgi:hypothetical protein